ncbi:MAG: cell division protein FtsA [Patescibacteria group bacterium]|jgi:cell division protein FtsA
MPHAPTLVGLDLGSTTVRVVVGSVLEAGQGIQVLGVGEHVADGISKGAITSIEDAISSISGALEQAERMTGIPITHAYVGINGTHITSQEAHGVVAVAKADGEIKEADVERVIEAAQTMAVPSNTEILHVIPRTFTVDNQKGVKDPIGMSGIRLEVDAQIIQGLQAQVKNLTKCIYRTGVEIDDMVMGVLAASEAVLTKRQKEIGVCLVNLGASTTSVIVFEEGDVLHTAILPVGAGHVTNDIAIGLRTSIDVAEQVKLEYGTATPEEVSKRDEINLAEVDSKETGVVSRKHVAEIIEARTSEIFSMVEKELQKVDRSGLLPAGIVLVGGGAKLLGIVDIAKREFRLPAAVGTPLNLMTAIDKVQDPQYAAAVGLVAWGAALNQSSGNHSSKFSTVNDVIGKLRGWVKHLTS